MSINKLALDSHKNIRFGIQTFFHIGDSIIPYAHSHNFYEIFFVTEGSAIHWCNSVQTPIESGSLIFIRPEDTHQYLDSTQDFAFYNLVFSKDTFDKIFSLYDRKLIEENLLDRDLPPGIKLNQGDIEIYKRKFQRDISTLDLKIRSLHNVELLTSLLPLFITSNFYKVNRQPDWFQKLTMEIERDANYTKGVNYLYSIATRSREHVSRNFKKYLNVTPTEYINHKKLIYASNLLIQTNLEILDISDMAGFPSHSHFYNLFKKEYKTSPRKYREKNLLSYI
ncbi:AraC family transcriptional regulator [Thiospirochaeta perfilievii]|nr:AraC family transcriptional regulator [Thiospirochaeta perfilievii]